MKITAHPSALRQTKLKDYAVRFVFGGLITAAAGVVATKYGPVIGGLFLAFPAILPASLTLVEKHTREKEQKQGEHDHRMCPRVAGVDAAGAALGSLALAVFAWIVWKGADSLPSWEMLLGAGLAWIVSAGCLWAIRQKI